MTRVTLCIMVLFLVLGSHAQQGPLLLASLNVTDGAGAKQGLWVEYHPDQRVRSVMVYRDGLLEGQAIYFDDRGNVEVCSNYVKGKKHGLTRAIDPVDGTIRLTLYNHDTLETVQIFTRDGILVIEEFYQGGQFFRSLTRTDTGIIEGRPSLPRE